MTKARNPFNPGDTVWYHNELFEVVDVLGNNCFVVDLGEKVPGIIQLWVNVNELERAYDDDEEDPWETVRREEEDAENNGEMDRWD